MAATGPPKKGPLPLLNDILGVYLPGEHPLYAAVFYARARVWGIECNGKWARLPDWMIGRLEEPSQARIAREIGVRVQSVASILPAVRRAAPDLDAIVDMARSRWRSGKGVRVRWAGFVRDAGGLKPWDRLVHAFITHELSGRRPRPRWTYEQIANLLGCSATNVGKKVRKLVSRGLLVARRGRTGRATRYWSPSESGTLTTSPIGQGRSSPGVQGTTNRDGTEGSGVTERTCRHDGTGSLPKTLPREKPKNAHVHSRDNRFAAAKLCAELSQMMRVPGGRNVVPSTRKRTS